MFVHRSQGGSHFSRSSLTPFQCSLQQEPGRPWLPLPSIHSQRQTQQDGRSPSRRLWFTETLGTVQPTMAPPCIPPVDAMTLEGPWGNQAHISFSPEGGEVPNIHNLVPEPQQSSPRGEQPTAQSGSQLDKSSEQPSSLAPNASRKWQGATQRPKLGIH